MDTERDQQSAKAYGRATATPYSTDESQPEGKVIDRALYLLSCQWGWDQDKTYGKRMALLVKLREVGEKRLLSGVTRCCQEHIGDFCPNMATIATFIPSPPDKDKNVDEERRQAKLRRLYHEGSDQVLSASEAQAFIKIYIQRRAAEDNLTFRRFWDEFLELRTEVRKAGAQMKLEAEQRGGEFKHA